VDNDPVRTTDFLIRGGWRAGQGEHRRRDHLLEM